MRFGVDRRVSWVVVVSALVVVVCVSPVGLARAQGTCANEQLRAEQPYGLGLADCRAYEMVSPLEKNDNGAIISIFGGLEARAAVSGEAVAYGSVGLFGEPVAGYIRDTYISSRGSGGWSTRNISPRLEAGGSLNSAGGEPPFLDLAFTPDLSKGIVTRANTQLTEGVTSGYEEMFLADIPSGSYRLVSEIPGTHEGVRNGEPYAESGQIPEVIGTSTDLSHVVYAPDLGTPTPSVDEWVNGESYEVSVDNSGNSIPSAGGSGNDNGEGSVTFKANVWHAVSSDGSRVFMTSPTGQSQQDRELYVRENPERPQSPTDESGKCTVSADACTIRISASQRKEADPNAASSPTFFWGASADGSKAFFTSAAELTDDARTGPADNAPNLYEYDLETGRLNDLSVDVSDPDGASVLGVMQISEDGSYVYFVAEGVLNGNAVAGQANLYVSHDGGPPKFIAALANNGIKGFDRGFERVGDEGSWLDGPTLNQAAVSRGGARLTFVSLRSLTGYDNELAENVPAPVNGCAEQENDRCDEVYVYDASTGDLVCASCNPSGARPIGPSVLNTPSRATELPEYRLGNMSEDGTRVFFDSADSLVAHDSNGRGDVYEYEDGEIHPISNVASSYDSSFVDASASGNDVFIGTNGQLLAQDSDSLFDVYDARVGGGFPVVSSRRECDNGDSCKEPVSPQPAVFGAPASATFSGAGNATAAPESKPVVKAKAKPKKCKRGFVERRSNCVKLKRHKSGARAKRGRK